MKLLSQAIKALKAGNKLFSTFYNLLCILFKIDCLILHYFSLHHHLTEHLNVEIVLGTIENADVAQDWLKSTFLYRRMQENPKYYGIFSLIFYLLIFC